MHSRIFQVSTSPIKKEDYINESHYWDHWFTNEWADYVSDDCDRKDDIDWLEARYSKKGIEFGADENGEYFIVKNKQTYFADKFEHYKEIIDKLKQYTLDDFVNGLHEMWSLKNLHEDKTGFYADVDGELVTFDGFVRLCVAEEKYYVGGTVDYHF